MFLDALARLANAQAFIAGTTPTTDKYDLGDITPRRDPGAGEPMALVFTVDVAAAGATDTTQLQLVSDEDAAIGSPTVHVARTIANALLTAGSRHVIPIPPRPQNYERYLAGRVVLGVGDTLTASCYIVPMSHIESLQYHAAGYES